MTSTVHRQVDLQEILLYYDAPQLVVGADAVGTRYLCLLVDEEEERDTYLCVAVSKGRLSDFVAGRLDLREVLEHPELKEQFVAHRSAGSGERKLALRELATFPDGWLPDAGFFFEPSAGDVGEPILAEATERNRAVVHLAVSPPESKQETRIDAYHLSEAIGIFQSVVKYAYRKALAKLSPATRRILSGPENYGLDVFAFSEGSFTIHFESKVPADLVGYVNIVQALETIDRITQRLDKPEEALSEIQALRGHFARSYRRLLEYVVLNNAPLSYRWITPELGRPVTARIPVGRASELYELLNKHEDLSVERVEITGRLVKASVLGREWTLLSDADGQQYHGYVAQDSTASLSGLILDSRYSFVCEERIVGVIGTGEEKRRLQLIEAHTAD